MESSVHKTIYHASDMCPAGCGQVIYLEGISNKRIFCYCTGCGIAFDHPNKAQWDSDIDEMKHIKDLSPEGVRYPMKEAIEMAGFGDNITGVD
ncbi:hypothetical protein MAH1_36990 [Sessilibacter sp. MAH1]